MKKENKKIKIMETCFMCYEQYGLFGTGIKTIAHMCNCNIATLYQYFKNQDDLILQSTKYIMEKILDEIMEQFPKEKEEILPFIDQIPDWAKENHGKKLCLMYQIYTHPKYREHAQDFLQEANRRYMAYSKEMEKKTTIPYDKIVSLIFVFVRSIVHYAMFEDETYIQTQKNILKETLDLFIEKYKH